MHGDGLLGWLGVQQRGRERARRRDALCSPPRPCMLAAGPGSRRCKQVYYCTPACMMSDWERHQAACNI